MSFETAPFGNGLSGGDSNVVTNVSQHYNARETGKTSGVAKTEGFVYELTLDIDGEMVGNEAFELVAPQIPAGSIIEDVYLVVEEAFVLGGTTPAIEVGTEGSEATNGVTITEAQAEAAGTYNITSAVSGTWAAGLAADTTVGLALSGTSPTVTDAGKLRVLVRYVDATT